MAQSLTGKRIAILATDGVEQSELQEPYKALKQAGATVDVVSPKSGEIQSMVMDEKFGEKIKVDKTLDEARPEDYDAVHLPGGVANPDRLRIIDKAVAFARHFWDAQKPIGVLCHGPWTLINAGVVKGLQITSWPSLQVDLQNAGANWVDQQLVVDRGVISSRSPKDLPAFCPKIVEEFGAGKDPHRQAAE
ncbi:MAG TPA: type 1 glutamine amidotransferase domain-containing protein [Stellaceae bacterium]